MKSIPELSPSGLQNLKKIAIVCHANPDGDAVGSLCSLYGYLSNLGKEVSMIAPDPLPYYLNFLPFSEYIIIAENQPELAETALKFADLVIALDHSRPNRTGDFLNTIWQSLTAETWCIDHHPDPDPNYSAYFHQTEASSTCELIGILLENKPVNKEISTAIFCGLLTDTGCFRHAVRPETFALASRLLQEGVEYSALVQRLFDTQSELRLRLLGKVLADKMQTIPEAKTVIAGLSNQELAEFQAKKGDTEGIVNHLLSMDTAEIAIFAHERTPGEIRISFRSKGKIPINAFAEENFGGGGHKNAAGGRYMGTLDDAISSIKKQLPAYVAQFTS
jgi:bifunctional oligoribonuclease and PAP phosphatase NrnA